MAVPDFDGVCSEKTFVFAPANDRHLLEAFLPYVLRCEAFHMYSIAQSRGSVNPYVNWRELAEYQFRLPPVEVQRRIAEVMSTAVRSLDSQRDLLRQLGTFVRAHRAAFFDRNWDTVPLSELVEMQLGKMLSPAARRGPNQRPYIGNVSVRWAGFDLSTVKTMHFESGEREKFRLIAGDVLVCEGGEVGRAAVWSGELEECYYQKALHRLRVRDPRITSDFIVEYLHWSSDSNRLGGLVGESTIAHLTEVKLRSLPVPVPPKGEREAFEHNARLTRTARQRMHDHLARLDELERGLSAQLVEGNNTCVH